MVSRVFVHLVIILFFCGLSVAQDSDQAFDESAEIYPDLEPLNILRDAVPLEYEVIFHQTERDLDIHPYEESVPDPKETIRAFDRQEIRDEQTYLKAFGKPSDNIDWNAYRILVLTETTVYKLGELDSTSMLSGIYLSGDKIVIKMTFTNYGPCQGIAQLPEWFSHATRTLFVKLPVDPVQIDYSYDTIGGCPPDIP